MDADGKYFAVDYLTAATQSVLPGTAPAVTALAKHVVVVGGGDTGNDCVGTALRQGCQSIVQLEMMPKAPENRPAGIRISVLYPVFISRSLQRRRF